MQYGIPAHSCVSGISGKCRNSWSYLPIPELQISHGSLNDHLQSLNKCKAKFLLIPAYPELVGNAGIPGHSCLFLNYTYRMDR
jgi:hypothetical protein